jgi:hypothetical protein
VAKRNNRQVVSLALRHVCLPGAINKAQLEIASKVLDEDAECTHFVLLLKDEYAMGFRGLYAVRITANGAAILQRIYGAGPLVIATGAEDPAAADGAPVPWRIYKFDTGAKQFSALQTRQFSNVADAVTLAPRLRNAPPPL